MVATSAPADFLYKDVPALGKRVHRLGLACNYGIDSDGIRAAFDRGINYVFWTPFQRKGTSPLKDALKRDREKIVVATGPTFGFFGGGVRRGLDRALKALDTDYVDVFQIFWLGTTSALTEGVVEELVRLRESGKVKRLGVSIHDRARAGRLAEDSVLDLLMIRYNAAHPGAERDIFPHLEKRKPAVVAYTATNWRKLLKQPRGWEGRVPDAGDCYRFCLSNPNVDLTLCGPASITQLDENLAALERGPLNAEEDKWMRDLGAFIHG